MLIINNFEQITYNKFIQNIIDTRGRFNCGDEYHERHHIIPRCLGGTNDENNLIDLFAREHFIAHKLLAIENPNVDGLVYAWWCMSNMIENRTSQTDVLTPEEYEEAKKVYSKLLTGKPFTDEHRRKISDAIKGKRKHVTEEGHLAMVERNKNRIWSKESREKLSKTISGENHPRYGTHWSEEQRKMQSEAHKDIQSGEKNPRALITLQLDKYDNLIKIWSYAKLASIELKINYADICSCAKGRLKSANGYHWKYLYDNTFKGEPVLGAISLGIITEKEALEILEKQNNKL